MKNYNLIIATFVCLTVACTPVQPVQEVVNEPSFGAPEDAERIRSLEEEHTLLKAGYADSVNAGFITDDSFKGSARRDARTMINGAEIAINYGSPGKRGRVLWNGLVSYNQVWVSGSHWATAVHFGREVIVAGERIAEGTYALFTIPGEEMWTIILNENYDQHLAEDYDESLDVARLEVKPNTLDAPVQRLTYSIE